MKRFILVLSAFIMHFTFAQSIDYYDEHTQGWHWYHEIPEKKLKEKNESHNQPVMTNISASDQLKLINQEVNEAKAKAVLQPSIENLKNYLVLQQQVTNQAQIFADVWKQVLLYYPTLDYSIEHPTNQLARQSQLTNDSQAQDKKIAQIAKHYGLFFFYRSTCPYCHRFAPILKAFAEYYGFTLLPITLDEAMLEEFPESKQDEGQAQKFNVSMVPALFAVNPKTNQVVPAAYGLVSWNELKEQLVVLK